ncbi:hypothetical protein HDU93_001287 [Gonapodya sp. JEL0774]|nr:hypothetical protein HDU93_001287 [Gonapodya sp. JEL0774]
MTSPISNTEPVRVILEEHGTFEGTFSWYDDNVHKLFETLVNSHAVEKDHLRLENNYLRTRVSELEMINRRKTNIIIRPTMSPMDFSRLTYLSMPSSALYSLKLEHVRSLAHGIRILVNLRRFVILPTNNLRGVVTEEESSALRRIWHHLKRRWRKNASEAHTRLIVAEGRSTPQQLGPLIESEIEDNRAASGRISTDPIAVASRHSPGPTGLGTARPSNSKGILDPHLHQQVCDCGKVVTCAENLVRLDESKKLIFVNELGEFKEAVTDVPCDVLDHYRECEKWKVMVDKWCKMKSQCMNVWFPRLNQRDLQENVGPSKERAEKHILWCNKDAEDVEDADDVQTLVGSSLSGDRMSRATTAGRTAGKSLSSENSDAKSKSAKGRSPKQRSYDRNFSPFKIYPKSIETSSGTFVLSLDDAKNVKLLISRRQFSKIFSDPDLLSAYTIMYSPSRAFSYLRMFREIKKLRDVVRTRSPLRVTDLAGVAGSPALLAVLLLCVEECGLEDPSDAESVEECGLEDPSDAESDSRIKGKTGLPVVVPEKTVDVVLFNQFEEATTPWEKRLVGAICDYFRRLSKIDLKISVTWKHGDLLDEDVSDVIGDADLTLLAHGGKQLIHQSHVRYGNREEAEDKLREIVSHVKSEGLFFYADIRDTKDTTPDDQNFLQFLKALDIVKFKIQSITWVGVHEEPEAGFYRDALGLREDSREFVHGMATPEFCWSMGGRQQSSGGAGPIEK